MKMSVCKQGAWSWKAEIFDLVTCDDVPCPLSRHLSAAERCSHQPVTRPGLWQAWHWHWKMESNQTCPNCLTPPSACLTAWPGITVTVSLYLASSSVLFRSCQRFSLIYPWQVREMQWPLIITRYCIMTATHYNCNYRTLSLLLVCSRFWTGDIMSLKVKIVEPLHWIGNDWLASWQLLLNIPMTTNRDIVLKCCYTHVTQEILWYAMAWLLCLMLGGH